MILHFLALFAALAFAAEGLKLNQGAEKSVGLLEAGAEVSVGGFCYSGAGERESGKCDRRKGVEHWDSCNRCVRGSRWSWFNHWCCALADLQSGYGDCHCYYAQEDEESVGRVLGGNEESVGEEEVGQAGQVC